MASIPKEGERKDVSLKILYTLSGIDSQKFVVKPTNKIEALIYPNIELGVVEIVPCLNAIREASPDFASVCDTHSDEYAIYSADYAEEGHPLQSHGRVSQHTLTEATGKLESSKLGFEQLEILFHLLPVRRPEELIVEFQMEYNAHQAQLLQQAHHQPQLASWTDTIIDNPQLNSDAPFNLNAFPTSAAELTQSDIDTGSDMMMSPFNPKLFSDNVDQQTLQRLSTLHTLPPSLMNSLSSQLNHNNYTSPSSNSALPSSPPVRARPTKIASSRKRDSPNGSSSSNRRGKLIMPTSENVSQCGNCKVESASTWRRIQIPGQKEQLLCNACGLYYKTKKVMRPSFLWDKVKSRNIREMNLEESGISTKRLRLQSPISDRKDINTTPVPKRSKLVLPGINSSNCSSPITSTSTASTIELKSPKPQLDGFYLDKTGIFPPSDLIEPRHTSIEPALTLTAFPPTSSHPSVDPNSHVDTQTNTPTHMHDPNPIGSHDFPESKQKHPQETKNDFTIKQETENQSASPPQTPKRNSTLDLVVPDSIQKLFYTTPSGKTPDNSRNSNSANKWLDRVIDPSADSSYFESFLASPTPRKNMPSSDVICSSPPTSSSLFSDWDKTSKPRQDLMGKGNSNDVKINGMDRNGTVIETELM